MFPRALRQRCFVHKIRNLEVKVSAEAWREVAPHIFYTMRGLFRRMPLFAKHRCAIRQKKAGRSQLFRDAMRAISRTTRSSPPP
ncbi:MAG: hypothetical protein ACK4N4_15375 [Burkholderiales bacterium]